MDLAPAAGLSDKEVARRINRPPSTVIRARMKRKIQSASSTNRFWTPEEDRSDGIRPAGRNLIKHRCRNQALSLAQTSKILTPTKNSHEYQHHQTYPHQSPVQRQPRKSFEAEFRTAWLDYHGIQWNGSDLDDRHHSFFDRHPKQVQSYTLGNDDDSKSTLLGLFRNTSRSSAPVHVIECRAQADGLIVQALESLQLLESLATQGVRFTFFLFPSEDTESMSNLLDLFYFAGDRVDYVIVHNPAKVRTNLFKKSNIEAELKRFGAREITLPTVTSITLLAIKRTEAKAGRKLSFAEAVTPGTPHLELMLAGEMQWAMQQMFRQYDLIADLLVPSEQMPEVEPQTEPAAKPTRSKQPMLNLGE